MVVDMTHGFNDDLETAVLFLAGNCQIIRSIPRARDVSHILIIDIDHSEVMEEDPQLVVSLLRQHRLIHHDPLMVHSHFVVLEEAELLQLFSCWEVR